MKRSKVMRDEIARFVDSQVDVLDRIAFLPAVSDNLRLMDAAQFTE